MAWLLIRFKTTMNTISIRLILGAALVSTTLAITPAMAQYYDQDQVDREFERANERQRQQYDRAQDQAARQQEQQQREQEEDRRQQERYQDDFNRAQEEHNRQFIRRNAPSLRY